MFRVLMELEWWDRVGKNDMTVFVYYWGLMNMLKVVSGYYHCLHN